MMFPTINTKAVNVELTKDRADIITQKLAPLSRLVAEPGSVTFDVVIRCMHKKWVGNRYCVSVRMSTPNNHYYAVASEGYLNKSLARVRNDLRKSISRSYSLSEGPFTNLKQYITERNYREMLA